MAKLPNGTPSPYVDDKGSLLHIDYPLPDDIYGSVDRNHFYKHTPTGKHGVFLRGVSPLRDHEVLFLTDDVEIWTVWACHLNEVQDVDETEAHQIRTKLVAQRRQKARMGHMRPDGDQWTEITEQVLTPNTSTP